ALDDCCGERTQRADFGRRQSAGAQALLRRFEELGGLERGHERLQPAENGAGAGDGQLLRDDDRSETRETWVSAAKRGPSADRNQALDEFRVLGPQALGGLV